MTLSSPPGDELLPEQRRALEYLARKGTRASVDALRAQAREAFAAAERSFDDVAIADRERAPSPGKWSPHEILDHVVLSHGPAIPQLASLLAGVNPPGVAIPAGLHRAERPQWSVLREQLGEIHRELLRMIETASDDCSLQSRATVEMVVKVGSEPKHWFERLDWKAFVQAIRVHTLEHHSQLQRTLVR